MRYSKTNHAGLLKALCGICVALSFLVSCDSEPRPMPPPIRRIMCLSVDGIVTDESGLPIADAEIYLEPEGYPNSSVDELLSHTSNDGYYEGMIGIEFSFRYWIKCFPPETGTFEADSVLVNVLDEFDGKSEYDPISGMDVFEYRGTMNFKLKKKVE